jgi:hypothetical protein
MWTFQMEQEQRGMVDKKTGNLFQMEQMTPATMMRTGKELAAEGMTQREIAAVLGVSQKTVDRDLGESSDSPRSRNQAHTTMPSESDDSHSHDEDDWQESPPLLSVVDLNTGEIIPPPKRESEPQPTNADRAGDGRGPCE